MATLHVRDIPDETKDIVTEIAAREGTNLTEYIRRVLNTMAAEERQRRAWEAAHERIKEIQSRMTGPRPTIADGARAVREVRDEYARGDAP